MANRIYIGDSKLVECINPYTNKWIVLWDTKKEITERGEEITSHMSEVFNHKPTIEEIKNTILSWYNSVIENSITSSYVWQDIPVWISKENQLNFKIHYDLEMQSNGESLPIIFKLGTMDNPVYYEFKSLDELSSFYTGAIRHIQTVLSKGWEWKDSIDWSIYEILLNSSI